MYKPLVAVYVFDSYNALAQFLNKMFEKFSSFFDLFVEIYFHFEISIHNFQDIVTLMHQTLYECLTNIYY